MASLFYSLSRSNVSPQNILAGSRFLIFFAHPLTPVNGLVVCSLTYSVCLLFSYLRHALLDFSETGTAVPFYVKHTVQVQQFSDLSCYLICTTKTSRVQKRRGQSEIAVI